MSQLQILFHMISDGFWNQHLSYRIGMFTVRWQNIHNCYSVQQNWYFGELLLYIINLLCVIKNRKTLKELRVFFWSSLRYEMWVVLHLICIETNFFVQYLDAKCFPRLAPVFILLFTPVSPAHNLSCVAGSVYPDQMGSEEVFWLESTLFAI